jgi:hypothetical protein
LRRRARSIARANALLDAHEKKSVAKFKPEEDRTRHDAAMLVFQQLADVARAELDRRAAA